MLVFPRSWRASVRAALVILVVACAAVLPASPASAGTAGMGFVRLAHLSPDTPDVDVYLDALSYHAKQLVFPGVGYGVVSGYLSLKPGPDGVDQANVLRTQAQAKLGGASSSTTVSSSTTLQP